MLDFCIVFNWCLVLRRKPKSTFLTEQLLVSSRLHLIVLRYTLCITPFCISPYCAEYILSDTQKCIITINIGGMQIER